MDIEESPVIGPPSGSNSQLSDAPISLENTPFFHLDIVQAVRAAETSARRAEGGLKDDDHSEADSRSDSKLDI